MLPNTTAGTAIYLMTGAKAANFYWITTGAVTLGAASTLEGNIKAHAAVTVEDTSAIDAGPSP